MNPKDINKSFPLLDRKSDRYLLITVVFIFSVFFINFFKPWNIGRWHSDSGIIQILRLSSYGFVVALVFLFTQFPLRAIFKQQNFTRLTYAIWLLVEVALISLVYIFLYGNPVGNFINDFFFSIKYSLLGICLPYSFALLIIYYKNHQQKIAQLESKITHSVTNKSIVFNDENNKMRFSLQIADVLFIESTDNYVTVYFLKGGKVQRELLRNTLKNLETVIQDTPLVRCHRSFMVNTANIELVKKKGKKLEVNIRHLEKSIPVSEKYSPLFLSHLA